MKLYLSSNESTEFAIPREILEYHKIAINNRNVLVVEVDEPVIGQNHGLGGTDITRLYLVNRHVEDALAFDKLDKFPIHVYVLLLSGNNLPCTLKEFKNIAWACIYNNKEDAQSHKIEYGLKTISRL